MPIPLPNLDDRTYADLVKEIKALIPRYAHTGLGQPTSWTDFNESDPGVMLIEMFAWLSEALMYRTNRITEASERSMVTLLGALSTRLDDARVEAVHNVRARWRAITEEDFEQLVLGQADFHLARAKCLPELDLTAADPYTPRPSHVSIILIPVSQDPKPTPSPEIIQQAWNFLDERRLITCRHHVIGPTYTDIRVCADVVRIAHILPDALQSQILANLHGFFDPFKGGPDQTGWPFGRDVFSSEVYQVIENTPGVDHVESLTLAQAVNAEPWVLAEDNRLAILPNHLVCLNASSEITIRN